MSDASLSFFAIRDCLDYEPYRESPQHALDVRSRIINVVHRMDSWARTDNRIVSGEIEKLSLSLPQRIADVSQNTILSEYLNVLKRIHDERMVRFLIEVCPQIPALPGWISLRDQSCTPIDPSTFSRPEQIGYYCCDRLTPFDQSAIYSAMQSFHTAVKAAEAADAGHMTYAVCRTPGHHAAFETMGGFCYFNNAVGAVYAIRKKLGKEALIVVVDIDRHHGNGTESILRRLQSTPDFEKVAFISTHQDPALGYEPVFSGHATNLEKFDPVSPPTVVNLPYDPISVSESVPVGLVSRVDDILTAYSPQAIVVSLGVDALDSDPVDPGGWPIETFDAFGVVIGRHARKAQIVMGVHEGGYDDQRCGECSQRFWGAVLQQRSIDH